MQQVVEGTIQRNRRTGETRVFQGGQWVSQGGAAPGLPNVIQGPPKEPTPQTPLQVQNDALTNAKLQGDIADQQRKAAEDQAKAGKIEMGLKDTRATILDVIRNARKAQEMSRDGYFTTGVGSGIAKRFEGTSARDLTSLLSHIGSNTAFDRLQKMRDESPTGGALGQVSEIELQLLKDSVGSLDQGVSDEQFQRNIQQVIDSYSRVYERLGGDPGDLGQVAGDRDALTPSTNGSRTVDDPRLAGVRGEYLSRLAKGQSATEIVGFLRRAGITDPKVIRSAVEQVKFRRNNPQVPLDHYNTSVLDDMDVPLSSIENALNNAAQSAPGAYVMRAGNAVSGNNLDTIAGLAGGNEERARLALQTAGQQHPTASLAGDISGGVMAAMGGEAALARGGVAAGVGRSVAADTAYGGFAGAGGADGGDRLTGALYGGGAGLAGSLGGNALMRGLGATISPRGGNVNALYEAGVRPTPGQRLVNGGGGRGMKGLVGKAVNASEEALQSVPLVGSAIRGARQEARDQFQVGAFNQALGELGMKLPKGVEAGTKAHSFAQRAFDHAYNKAREGLKLVADEELSSDLGELSGSVANLAKPSIDRFNTILQNVVIRRANGSELSGAAFKDVQRDLGKTIRGIRKSQSGDGELADALEDLQHILDGAARRHSDPKAVELLDKADRGYAKFVRIEEASKAGGAMKDAGTFSPADLAGAVKRSETRVRSKAYSQGEALMQDYADQGKALSDRIPNSGSPERIAIGTVAAGGLGMVEPASLTLMGALTAAYAPGGRRVLKGVMTPRGPKAAALANKARDKAGLAGHVGGTQAALNGPKP